MNAWWNDELFKLENNKFYFFEYTLRYCILMQLVSKSNVQFYEICVFENKLQAVEWSKSAYLKRIGYMLHLWTKKIIKRISHHKNTILYKLYNSTSDNRPKYFCSNFLYEKKFLLIFKIYINRDVIILTNATKYFLFLR